MNERDEFAAIVMRCIIEENFARGEVCEDMDRVATASYKMADAMMEARKKESLS